MYKEFVSPDQGVESGEHHGGDSSSLFQMNCLPVALELSPDSRQLLSCTSNNTSFSLIRVGSSFEDQGPIPHPPVQRHRSCLPKPLVLRGATGLPLLVVMISLDLWHSASPSMPLGEPGTKPILPISVIFFYVVLLDDFSDFTFLRTPSKKVRLPPPLMISNFVFIPFSCASLDSVPPPLADEAIALVLDDLCLFTVLKFDCLGHEQSFPLRPHLPPTPKDSRVYT